MKLLKLAPILMAATLFLTTGATRPSPPAEAVPPPPPGAAIGKNADPGVQRHHKPHRDWGHRRDRTAFKRGYIIGKYDLNGDHKLDDTERVALRVAVEKRMRGRLEKRLARLNAIDADQDGKISDSEWAVAKDEFESFRKTHARRELLKGCESCREAPSVTPSSPATGA